ncbi:hypothetical protein RDI58_027222 [Solanum bulbocastanum]|uniref:RNase H type-1 domain-containing protein n=1 Tax=Solanum bulbocastanum TaxID=147425 RepID=A0AAN8T0E1_SOLBU
MMEIKCDGRCKDAYCGEGGVIRDHRGHLIFAYSLNLGQGTNNLEEAKTLLYEVEWCVRNEYDYILAESESKLFVDCVNYINFIPWRIHDEVKQLKAHMETTSFILSHYYIEANKVADLLTSLSYNMDRWEMTNFRT